MAETAPPVEAPGSKKKKPNRLLVEEATNDDNSVVALNTATMEELCVRAGLYPPSALPPPSPARRCRPRCRCSWVGICVLTGGCLQQPLPR